MAALKPRAARYALPDPELRGHYVRVQPNGSKSFVVVATDPKGKQKWVTLGAADAMRIDAARDRARATILRIRGHSRESFKEVAEQYIKRHVEAKGIRTQAEIERCLAKYIFPTWEAREFTSIKRSDIATLLDAVEDGSGPRQADCCLTIVRAITNFYAKRDDDYTSPFVRGMRRSGQSKRARILDDHELRTIWQTAEGTFSDIIRIALLTAQRRSGIKQSKSGSRSQTPSSLCSVSGSRTLSRRQHAAAGTAAVSRSRWVSNSSPATSSRRSTRTGRVGCASA